MKKEDNKGIVTEYRNRIIEMIKRIDDEKFLKQIYTIVIRHIRRTWS